MFGFVRRWFSRSGAAAREESAASKAWLDELRRNELSLNARRQLAPEEPVTAPHIGHGSAQPVNDIEQIVAGFSGRAGKKPGEAPDYGQDTYSGSDKGSAAAGTNGGAEGDAGGEFGGGGGSDSFSVGSGASSGDSGDNA